MNIFCIVLYMRFVRDYFECMCEPDVSFHRPLFIFNFVIQFQFRFSLATAFYHHNSTVRLALFFIECVCVIQRSLLIVLVYNIYDAGDIKHSNIRRYMCYNKKKIELQQTPYEQIVKKKRRIKRDKSEVECGKYKSEYDS